MTRADWHRAYRTEEKFVPRSHYDGIYQAVTVLAPLRAFISAHSGSLNGDLEALQRLLMGQVGPCDVCAATLTAKDAWHKEDCSLFRQAQEVLEDSSGFIKRQQLAHEARLQDRQAKKQQKRQARD